MARAPKDYKPEFEQLGLEAVRRELPMRRWDRDKLAAARLWVEGQDAQHWLSDHKDTPPREKPKWMKKWALYIIVVFGVGYAAVRIFRSLF